jgi:hypothetical protein
MQISPTSSSIVHGRSRSVNKLPNPTDLVLLLTKKMMIISVHSGPIDKFIKEIQDLAQLENFEATFRRAMGCDFTFEEETQSLADLANNLLLISGLDEHPEKDRIIKAFLPQEPSTLFAAGNSFEIEIPPFPSAEMSLAEIIATIPLPPVQIHTGTKTLETAFDLSKPPEFDPQFIGIRRATIGDLHGNPITLIHYLVKIGILEFNSQIPECEELYSRFCNIAYLSSLNKDHIKNENLMEYEGLLALLFPIKSKEIFFRQGGDLFTERIGNDIIMALTLEHLHENEVPYKIILGNHDSFFTAAIYFLMNIYSPKNGLEKILLSNKEFFSSKRLFDLFKKNILNFTDFTELARKVHLGHLELLSYEKKENGRDCIFSHAILLNKFINSFINKYSDEMTESHNEILEDDSVEEKIRKINGVFLYLIENKSKKFILDFLNLEIKDKAIKRRTRSLSRIDESIEMSPTFWILWARSDFFYGPKPKGMPAKPIDISEFDDTLGLISDNTDLIHGHTDDDILSTDGRTDTSLDNEVGKDIEQFLAPSMILDVNIASLFCQFQPIATTSSPPIATPFF